ISHDAVLADPLRMLRTFRFAAVLGFEIAPQTLAVINKQSHLIAKSAAERIT
ncbi:MAG: CCA tRNA nucleotidyltransferase, partial [Deltaproteobacteria bacterium]|nr:CCA tRNA nucleotidyltransferase [Deltaproteobacteria bacterium]